MAAFDLNKNYSNILSFITYKIKKLTNAYKAFIFLIEKDP